MKLTKAQLKRIIKEELAALHINEAYAPSADENALLNVIKKDFFGDDLDEARQFLSWWYKEVDTSNNPNSKPSRRGRKARSRDTRLTGAPRKKE